MSASPESFRALPKVDRLAASELLAAYPPRIRSEAARLAIQGMRSEIAEGLPLDADPEARAAIEAEALTRMRTRPAINMSGILLHTGLGRARWAPSAAEAAYRAAASHAVTEFDLPTGQRGDRQSHVEDLLCELTGAEAALVVNNCAAAVVLSLAAVAKGREVILSRGQMVEIGGAFRMPDVIRESGCRLVEAGCTNKTRLKDFEDAMGPETGAILRCHPSNYAIVGFAEQPEPADLARLARKGDALFLDDAGSGCLVDTAKYGLAPERTLRQAVEAGADLVMASGDKLLGGPQAGLILGRRKAVKSAKKHPLARAMRIDKITLAALEATLRLYREGREEEIPLWASLARPLEEIARDARRLARAGGGSAVRTECRVGGGSLPGQAIPSWAARIPAASPNELARRLRMAETPLIGRIEDGAVLLDPRSADPQEVKLAARLLEAVRP